MDYFNKCLWSKWITICEKDKVGSFVLYIKINK